MSVIVGSWRALAAPSREAVIPLIGDHAISAAGRRTRTRWIVFARLLFAIAPMLSPGAITDFLTTGLGSGAVGIALIAIACGYSLGQVGPIWARISCGVVAWAGAIAVAATVPLLGTASDALSQPRGDWATVLAFSSVAVLMIATSIPLRDFAHHRV